MDLRRLVEEVEIQEFKEGLRSFIIEAFDVDIATSDFAEFLDYDLSVFKRNFGDYLDQEEFGIAENFLIMARSVYLTTSSRVEILSFAESNLSKRFSIVYGKLKHNLCVI